MKKSFKIYSLIWAICLALFNVITFVTPNEVGGVSKFSGSFWVGYIFTTVAFIGQLTCAFVAFKAENLKKFFYNIPLLSISYGGLVTMLVVGSIFMVIPVLPEWIAIIVCVIILAFNAIAIIKATASADIVSGIDEKIKTQTFFIKSLSVDAQSLMTSATSDELRAEAKKVYEAIRYSDPMANTALSDIDAQIEKQFNAFSDAIKTEDTELARVLADVLTKMIVDRTLKSKLLK
jgi:hypothetical protein